MIYLYSTTRILRVLTKVHVLEGSLDLVIGQLLTVTSRLIVCEWGEAVMVYLYSTTCPKALCDLTKVLEGFLDLVIGQL